jgi:hypothetical protein
MIMNTVWTMAGMRYLRMTHSILLTLIRPIFTQPGHHWHCMVASMLKVWPPSQGPVAENEKVLEFFFLQPFELWCMRHVSSSLLISAVVAGALLVHLCIGSLNGLRCKMRISLWSC